MSTTNFRISSELKNVIGRDLITDDYVAIFELVKNSFDARATNVKIVFDFDNSPKDAIYIIDDGKGMSAEDIESKWLFVAYSAKKDGTEDINETIPQYAGNKGVGRFSCDRLGRYLHLEAKTESSSKVNTVDIDWGDFEKNSKAEFSTIPVSYNTINSFSRPRCLPDLSINHGVVLRINSLRDPEHWTKNKILNLKRALSKLIDPFNGQISQRKIEIISPRDKQDDQELLNSNPSSIINGIVENNLFELLNNKTTALKARISKNLLLVELVDRGMHIYTTEENIEEDFPELLNINFDAIISFLNKSAKSTFTKKMGLPSVQYGSLFLIRNGFRVYPIGEESDDFWTIDRRKQQGYNRFIGTRDILGRISIQGTSDSFNEMFKEASSRNQGLIKTKAVISLQECVLRCIRKLEAYLTTVTWLDALDKEEDTPIRLNNVENKSRIIDLIKKLSLSPKISITFYNKDIISILSDKSDKFQETLNNLKLIAEKNHDQELDNEILKAERKLILQQKALDEAQRIAQAETEARQKAESIAELATRNERIANEQRKQAENNLEEEKKRNLFLIASSSKEDDFLKCFIHQIKIYASNAKLLMQDYLIHAQTNSLTKEDIIVAFSDQIEALENIFTLTKFAIFGNFRLDSEKIKDDLCSFIEQYITKLAPAYESRIKISCNHCPGQFVICFNPIEIAVILDNLISNAKKAGAPQLHIDMKTSAKALTLTVVDNGSGILCDPKRIFEKGYTRTNGSGLGLYFCQKLLNKLNGTIVLSDNQPEHGTSFTIRIANNEN